MWQTGNSAGRCGCWKNPQNISAVRAFVSGDSLFSRRGAFFQIGGEEAFFRQGVDVPLRDKLRIGVFDCDDADAEVFRKAALRGQFCAGRDLARQNVLTDALIQVHIKAFGADF